MSSMYGCTVRSVLKRSRHAWTESANNTKAKHVDNSMIHIICFSLDGECLIASIIGVGPQTNEALRVHYRRAPTRLTPPFMLPPAL
jgi:hypothetical protein